MTEDMLSIDDAAQLLNVGRDYSVDLLDAGMLPSRGSGDARRIRREYLVVFKAARDADQRDGLRELSRLTEEFGGYDAERDKPTAKRTAACPRPPPRRLCPSGDHRPGGAEAMSETITCLGRDPDSHQADEGF